MYGQLHDIPDKQADHADLRHSLVNEDDTSIHEHDNSHQNSCVTMNDIIEALGHNEPNDNPADKRGSENINIDNAEGSVLELCPTEEETRELENDPIDDLLDSFPDCSGLPPSKAFQNAVPSGRIISDIPDTFCKECKVEYMEVETYRKHRLRVHGEICDPTPYEPTYLCTACGRTWSSLQYRREHNCPNVRRSSHICNMCRRDCRTAKGLREHLLRVHHIQPKRRAREVSESQRGPDDLPSRSNNRLNSANHEDPDNITTHVDSNAHTRQASPQSGESSGYGTDNTFNAIHSGNTLNGSGDSENSDDPPPIVNVAGRSVSNILVNNTNDGINYVLVNNRNTSDNSNTHEDTDISTCPTANVRTGDTLHLLFPSIDPMKCPEDGCGKVYSSQSWSSNKSDLKRHLREHHKILIKHSRFWCSLCQDPIDRPSKHACLQNHNLMIFTTESLRFPCNICVRAFPSELGLRNHVQNHKKKEAQSQQPDLVVPKIVKRPMRKKRNEPPVPLPPEEEDTNIVNAENALAPSLATEHEDAILNREPQQEESIFAIYLRRFRSMEQADLTEEHFHAFEELVDQYCTDTRAAIVKQFSSSRTVILNSDNSDPITHSSPADDAPTIQRMYRRNKKRAVREISGQQGEKCTVDPARIHAHFSATWSPGTSDREYYPECDEHRVEVLDRPLTIAEVSRKLRSADNTSPGPDKITYNHWRKTENSVKTLTSIFNLCIFFKRIPASWKKSTTILLPKTGDPSDLRNWRPIALSNTIYKLFAKCLATRFSNWCSRYSVLSHCQKGFLPFDGVMEHNFSLQYRKIKARKTKKDLCITWLDVSNAFGDIPHSAILDALNAAKTGDAFRDLITDFYTDCTTQILAQNTRTEEIGIRRGVKQGCPLSGILFNLTIDPSLRRIQGDAADHKILAFADDIALIAESPSELQEMLDSISSDFKKISLQFNPNKSVAFHLATATPVGTRVTEFLLGGVRLKTIEEFEFHKFLGTPFGYNPVRNLNNLSEIAKLGESILTSLLAPWQRLDALKCFVFPAMQFAMRTNQYLKLHYKAIDREFRKGIKQTLNLPSQASNKFLYGSRKLGCCAIPIAAEEMDLNLIDTAFKLLTSIDSTVQNNAINQLTACVRFRNRSTPTDEDLGKYLSGEIHENFLPHSNDFSSIWTAARFLQSTWCLLDD
ncbi:Retrovirus-related Pol polyprotein from type-1 retrotransposable element R2 [Araneus ventricosus]|uniref:Retrovirus-related Pol polyprotein from type-1 retrotransposable element R2 n=1 Tax=Araneus ventricosus TaxID=182803 RepID=A0A4Y2MEZ2_ARAVE|nr:Retrovirus-related Pol polyprotein from type-1 retrotransposable element R2 [Araneus ventricosus]